MTLGLAVTFKNFLVLAIFYFKQLNRNKIVVSNKMHAVRGI